MKETTGPVVGTKISHRQHSIVWLSSIEAYG